MATHGMFSKTSSPPQKTDINKNAVAKVKKPRQKKKKRLIIRNLSFKVEKEELKNIFSKFGTVKEAVIPLKDDGKKRGFGFVEFEDTKSLIKAMKSMNWKEIHGRKVAVDFAVDKNTYQAKVQTMKKSSKEVSEANSPIKSEVEIKQEPSSDNEESEDEEEKNLNNFLKEFYSGADKLTLNNESSSSEEESTTEESENEDSDNDGDSKPPKKKIKKEPQDNSSSPKGIAKKRESKDIAEGKTVFLRNVAFSTTEDSLTEVLEKYGDCEYCLLCMDRFTNHPKGTAFVKFKDKESADKLIEESCGEPGVVVEGRRLVCAHAISREDVSHIGEDSKRPKDKRNLNLLRVGLIMPNSSESEGVSPSDMSKRAQLEMMKRQKLKNVNFFVSDKRLMIHNLPKGYTDEKMRKLLQKVVRSGAVITEARVMKEFKKVDANGIPMTKGYGFASFKNHEDALKALNELNNNPHIFTALKRPIAEFSVENKVALLAREKRKEKMRMRNKRKADGKEENLSNKSSLNTTEGLLDNIIKKRKRKRGNRKKKPVERNVSQEAGSSPTKEIISDKQKNNRKRKRKNMKEMSMKIDPNSGITKEIDSTTQKKIEKKDGKFNTKKKPHKNSQHNITQLVNKFKNKLINKIT